MRGERKKEPEVFLSLSLSLAARTEERPETFREKTRGISRSGRKESAPSPIDDRDRERGGGGEIGGRLTEEHAAEGTAKRNENTGKKITAAPG